MQLPATMKSIIYNGGEVDPRDPGASLEVVEKPVPTPAKGEVLVKVEASTCNPSDLLSMRGEYSVHAAEGQTMGFEGCGRVVSSNAGAMGLFLKGKRISCGKQHGDGMWAEYSCLPASSCIPVGNKLPVESAAAFIVNPITAYAMMSEARNAGAKCVIQTAGASQVGRGVVGLGKSLGIETISIVRRDEQVKLLKALGAPHVLNQNSKTFDSEVEGLISRINPTVFLDAVGGDLTARIQRHLPNKAEIVVYGYLDENDKFGGRYSTQDLIFKNHTIRNFWLAPYLEELTLLGGIKASNAVLKLFKEGVFRTEVASVSKMDDYPAAITSYVRNMTSGKALLSVNEDA